MRLRKALVASAVLTAITTTTNPISAQIRVCQPCPSGQWSAGGPATTCTACEAGHFCQGGNMTLCTAGQHCPAGSSNSQQCPVGHQCPNGIAQACPVGTFQPSMSQASCNSCGNGWDGGPTGKTSVGQCTFNFSSKTVLQARDMLRVDGARAWNVPSCSGSLSNNIRECGSQASNNNMQAGCFNSSGNTKVSSSTPTGGRHCYCRARISNSTWSSWGYLDVYTGAGNLVSYGSVCTNNCANGCAGSVGTWSGRASW